MDMSCIISYSMILQALAMEPELLLLWELNAEGLLLALLFSHTLWR